VSWGRGRIDVFARGSGGQLLHIYRDNGPWSGWEDLGGVFMDGPTVISRGPYRTDCFVRGTDNALWHKQYENNRWTSWQRIGYMLLSAPMALYRAPNMIEIYTKGFDSNNDNNPQLRYRVFTI
jgi:hypothetical protein